MTDWTGWTAAYSPVILLLPQVLVWKGRGTQLVAEVCVCVRDAAFCQARARDGVVSFPSTRD